MKFLVFFFFCFDIFCSVNIGYSFYTKHLDTYELYENNKLVTFEYQVEDKSIAIAKFINSYEKESYFVSFRGYGYQPNNEKLYGVTSIGVVKGYSRVDFYKDQRFDNLFVFKDDYGFLFSIGVGYNFSRNFFVEIDTFGSAFVLIFKMKVL